MMTGAVTGDWLALAGAWAHERMDRGTPVQHLTGEACFYGRFFACGPAVLIPRPETEVLVESALREIGSSSATAITGAEIGIGSGIISITLLLEHRGLLAMVASEISSDATQVALQNASRFGVTAGQLSIQKSDGEVWEPLLSGRPPGGFDFLVSNPPYLMSGGDASVGEVESGVAEYEPHQALFAPAGDPTFFYRRIAEGAPRLLRPGGWVWLEIPHERADEIASIFERYDPGLGLRFVKVRVIKDLTGRPRVLAAQWAGSKS